MNTISNGHDPERTLSQIILVAQTGTILNCHSKSCPFEIVTVCNRLHSESCTFEIFSIQDRVSSETFTFAMVSIWNFVQRGLCHTGTFPFGLCFFGSVPTLDCVHLRFCPVEIVSIRKCVHSVFCPFRIVFIWDRVCLRLRSFGIVSIQCTTEMVYIRDCDESSLFYQYIGTREKRQNISRLYKLAATFYQQLQTFYFKRHFT